MRACAQPAAAALALLCLQLLACQRPETGVAAASARAQPHAERFREFCRWARRAHEGKLPGRDLPVLAETAFAPVRHSRDVLAAWLTPPDADQQLSLPRGTELPDVGWVSVRTQRFGTMEVAGFGHCPLDVPRWWRADAQDACVLLAADIEVAGEAVRVVVAYRDTATDAAAEVSLAPAR